MNLNWDSNLGLSVLPMSPLSKEPKSFFFFFFKYSLASRILMLMLPPLEENWGILPTPLKVPISRLSDSVRMPVGL